MKRIFIGILLCSLIFLFGCSAPQSESPKNYQEQQDFVNDDKIINEIEPIPFSNNQPGTKRVVPSTSKDGFSLTYNIYPQLTDESDNYITEVFEDLDGLFKYNNWSPVVFLDNENILFLAHKPNDDDYGGYRYNLRTKELKELFRTSTATDNVYITDAMNFGITSFSEMITVRNDGILSKVSFDEWRKEYEAGKIIANPNIQKAIIINSKAKSYLADLNTDKIQQLPFQEVYNACWIDDQNIVLGAVERIGSRDKNLILFYNIQNQKVLRTYLEEKVDFGDPYRNANYYCQFSFIGDYTGPPHGTLGVIDYLKKNILILELENAVDYLSLQNNWIITAVADKPVDWKVWGRTTEGTVLLCVYDVNTDTYIIRAKNLPRPGNSSSTQNTLISPDGRTVIYQAEGKVFINQLEAF